MMVIYLVGGFEPWIFMTFQKQLGMEQSSQLTKSIIFQRGRYYGIPPTSNYLVGPYYYNGD